MSQPRYIGEISAFKLNKKHDGFIMKPSCFFRTLITAALILISLDDFSFWQKKDSHNAKRDAQNLRYCQKMNG